MVRRRVVVWVGALALLSYALTAGPIMLQMAAAHASVPAEQAAGTPCPLHASHAQHQHPAGQPPLTDHGHCLFCQGSVAPGFITQPVVVVAPSFEATSFTVVQDSPLVIGHRNAAYASRAPPRLT